MNLLYHQELKIHLQPPRNKKNEQITSFSVHMQKDHFFYYYFPKLERVKCRFLTRGRGLQQCLLSPACREAAVCAGVGKLGTAQLGAAQPRAELTAPVPRSLHFKYMTRDNRWIETGAD